MTIVLILDDSSLAFIDMMLKDSFKQYNDIVCDGIVRLTKQMTYSLTIQRNLQDKLNL